MDTISLNNTIWVVSSGKYGYAHYVPQNGIFILSKTALPLDGQISFSIEYTNTIYRNTFDFVTR
jgi:hypothetical protein